MPYCPICKAEYRDGFTKCIDCGTDLIDELPEHDNLASKELFGHPEYTVFENEVVLETFVDSVQFMYVASALDEMGIHYLVRIGRENTFKGLYTLKPNQEKTIYVQESDYERAEEVLISLDAYSMEKSVD